MRAPENKSQIRETKAAAGGVLWKQVFIKLSQNLQEKNCVGLSPVIVLKKRL